MRGHAILAAFRVERRSVAVAVFIGTQLEFTDVKHLSADHQKAEASVSSFVNWILSSFVVTSAVIETFENGQELIRAQFNRTIEEHLRTNGTSLFKIGKSELLSAFGQPALKSRADVRHVVTTIWPVLDDKRPSGTKLDAVALGLYVQTERLFQN